MMKPEHLAKEAERLANDDVLIEALHQMRQEAFEALAIADTGDMTKVLRLQQRVEVISDFSLRLQQFILAGSPQEDGRTSVV